MSKVINNYKVLYQVTYPEKELTQNYPVKILVKNFYIYQRENVSKGRWHLYKKCEGLYFSQNKKYIKTSKIPNLESIKKLKSTPCRLCAAESYLITLLKCDLQSNSNKSLVFFTGQPNVYDRSNPTNFTYHKISESANKRIKRIINALGIPSINTPIGSVGYTRFSKATIKILAETFRTYQPPKKHQKENVTFDPEFFWTIYNDNPPELATYLGEDSIDAFAGAIAFAKTN